MRTRGAVRQYTSNNDYSKVYKSVLEASKATRFPTSSIYNAISRGTSYNGYHFEYVDMKGDN